ncbi:hypothetical protein EVA_20173 [gut metagenome]|uniref:Uncharacterized protein n=1 Tax=gut metagenome TaxID=749906 RepID=J9F9Y4_9ZZZZ
MWMPMLLHSSISLEMVEMSAKLRLITPAMYCEGKLALR